MLLSKPLRPHRGGRGEGPIQKSANFAHSTGGNEDERGGGVYNLENPADVLNGSPLISSYVFAAITSTS